MGVKVATLPVIALGVGIGVDYALYILSVMLARLREGMSLSEAYYRALLFTGKVVMLTGVTLAIGVITWVASPIKFQADMGNLQCGTPLDHEFYFPGYADGGISGDLQWNGNAVNNYQKMPHVITVNPVRQLVPRQQFPDAIIEGKARGYLWDGMAPEIQFAPFEYPMPGYPRIHMP